MMLNGNFSLHSACVFSLSDPWSVLLSAEGEISVEIITNIVSIDVKSFCSLARPLLLFLSRRPLCLVLLHCFCRR